jgi:putative transposase
VVKDHDFNKFSSTGGVVAIDVRIERLIVTSDGYYFPNLRPYENALNKVRRMHKELSRKKYLSKNWFKAGIKLARAYEHLKNLRRDIYMELGKWFAEHYDVVVMEDIEVRQLIGKSERILRRRLYDVAFHELKEILRHQLEKYGKL